MMLSRFSPLRMRNVHSRTGLLALACAIAMPAALQAQEHPIAFTGARILPVSGPAIEHGTLVVRGGKIVAVGANAAIPADAQRIDASGRTIMPGLVDTHSHIGQVAGGDGSAAIQPDVRVLDSFNPRHSGIIKARAGGITSVNVMPGSGHLMSGQTLYLKLRAGNTVEQLAYRFKDGGVAGGMKMANGTNPMRSEGPFPGTRAKSAAMARQVLLAGQDYCRGKRSPLDLGKEALCEVLSGKRTVHFHSHRADDIMTAIRLQKEFGFRMVLHHVSEGWKVAREIAAAKVPASVIVLDAPGGKLETMDASLETGATLVKAGVLTGFHTDDGISDSRLFLRQAGLAMRMGLGREEALRAMTINGARMMDIADRTGTLEAGKDADFIVLDGDPFSVYTHVQQTWVEGQLVFDRSRPEDLVYATGGNGAGHDGTASDILELEAREMEDLH